MHLAQTARRAAGLTQIQLAALLEVNRATVVRWEHGGTLPGPVAAILRVLAARPQETLAILRAPDAIPQTPSGADPDAADEAQPEFLGAGPPPPSHADPAEFDARRFGFYDPRPGV